MSVEKEPAYASAAAVAGLAREVEALRRTIDAVQALPAQVEELARVVTMVAKDAAAKANCEQVGAPSWLGCPAEISAVGDLLGKLTGWMAEVYLRYADGATYLPNCWLWHPDVVEELVWLMHAWAAAYRGKNPSVSRAGDWHDRYRPGVVRRIKTLAGNCSVENHQPRPGEQPVGGAPVVPLGEAMAPIAAWWAQRRDQPPPEPTPEHFAATNKTQRRARR